MRRLVALVQAAVATVAALAVLFGTAGPANAMVVNDMDFRMEVVCDSGYRTITLSIIATELVYDGSDSTQVHWWTVGTSHNGEAWSETAWQQRAGTFHESVTIKNAAPGTHSFYLRSWANIGGYAYDQSEFAYHEQRYLDGFAQYTGISCQM